MNHSDNAVSPIIGVVMMIVITVLLAAVIAAFVFGQMPKQDQTQNAAVSVFQTDSETVTITFIGSFPQGSVEKMEYSILPVQGPERNKITISLPESGMKTNISSKTGLGEKIKAEAFFKDGYRKIIFSQYPNNS